MADPRSQQHHDEVMAAWREVTGRTHYDATVDEAFPLDPALYLPCPYPYSSGDPVEVGRYFGAIAWFMRTVPFPAGARIVEMGSGWGHLASTLTATGYDVTAIDLNTASVDLLRDRCARLGIPLRVEHRAFLDDHGPELTDLDLVVFFEAFHHCVEPLALLDHCCAMLRPGGMLAFLSETFYDDFHLPWGVRLDEQAVTMARQEGWLELGFHRDFLYRELNARGLALQHTESPELGAYGTLLLCTLTADGNTFAGTLAPAEAATWHTPTNFVGGVSLSDAAPTKFVGVSGRLATEGSVVSLTEVAGETATVTMVNLTDSPLRVSLDAGGERIEVLVAVGERRVEVVPLTPPATGRRVLRVSSDQAASAALGLARAGICVESVAVC